MTRGWLNSWIWRSLVNGRSSKLLGFSAAERVGSPPTPCSSSAVQSTWCTLYGVYLQGQVQAVYIIWCLPQGQLRAVSIMRGVCLGVSSGRCPLCLVWRPSRSVPDERGRRSPPHPAPALVGVALVVAVPRLLRAGLPSWSLCRGCSGPGCDWLASRACRRGSRSASAASARGCL